MSRSVHADYLWTAMLTGQVALLHFTVMRDAVGAMAKMLNGNCHFNSENQ